MTQISKIAGPVALVLAGTLATGGNFLPPYDIVNPAAVYAEQPPKPNLAEIVATLDPESRKLALVRAALAGKVTEPKLVEEVVIALFNEYGGLYKVEFGGLIKDALTLDETLWYQETEVAKMSWRRLNELKKSLEEIGPKLATQELKTTLYGLAAANFEALVRKNFREPNFGDNLFKAIFGTEPENRINRHADTVYAQLAADCFELAGNHGKAVQLYQDAVNSAMKLMEKTRKDHSGYFFQLAVKAQDPTAQIYFLGLAVKKAEVEGDYKGAAKLYEQVGDNANAAKYNQLDQFFQNK